MSDECSICQKCGCSMTIPDDLENTGFCNECAQSIAISAEAFVLAHKEDFEAMKNSDSMDRDVNFTGLCAAVLPVEEL